MKHKTAVIVIDTLSILIILGMIIFMLTSCSSDMMRYDSNSARYKREHGIHTEPVRNEHKPIYK